MKFAKICIMLSMLTGLHAQDKGWKAPSRGIGSDGGLNTGDYLITHAPEIKSITDNIGSGTVAMAIGACSVAVTKLAFPATAFKAGMVVGSFTAKAGVITGAVVSSPVTVPARATLALYLLYAKQSSYQLLHKDLPILL